MELSRMWSAHLDMMWDWWLPLFSAVGLGFILGLQVLLLAMLARKVLLATLEVAVIVEAAKEAKRQDRAPILQAWTRLGKRWRDG